MQHVILTAAAVILAASTFLALTTQLQMLQQNSLLIHLAEAQSFMILL